MSRPHLHSYTDGSCPKNPGPGGWAFAIVLEDEGCDNIEESGFAKHATNNTMEMMAGLECLHRLRKEKLDRTHLCFIWSDSNLLVTGMQVWRHTWADYDFDGVKNPDLWRELHKAANAFDALRFRWLRGHRGQYWNERCDAMAGAAVRHGKRRQV